MKLKLKKLHSDAIAPEYATHGAACFDLRAVNIGEMTIAEQEVLRKHGNENAGRVSIFPGESVVFRTGLAVEIPEGHVMLIFSRSGHGFKHGVKLANATGVIDSDYRGEIQVKLTCNSKVGGLSVSNGDRIAQALVLPVEKCTFEFMDELSDTSRGEGGFGSTGSN